MGLWVVGLWNSNASKKMTQRWGLKQLRNGGVGQKGYQKAVMAPRLM